MNLEVKKNNMERDYERMRTEKGESIHFLFSAYGGYKGGCAGADFAGAVGGNIMSFKTS